MGQNLFFFFTALAFWSAVRPLPSLFLCSLSPSSLCSGLNFSPWNTCLSLWDPRAGLRAYTAEHNKLWNILKEMGIPDHLTCLLRNLYAGQEATVRTGHRTTDWFQIGKGVRQGCILSPHLFNLYAEYIMRNTGIEEAQAGIKIARRNINNLRYADDTTLVAESEEELKASCWKWKRRVKKLA